MSHLRRWLPPVLLIAALFALWQIAASSGFMDGALNLEDFLVPSPAQIFEVMWQDRGLISDNALTTSIEIVAGFTVALVVGLLAAALLHLSDLLRRTSYP